MEDIEQIERLNDEKEKLMETQGKQVQNSEVDQPVPKTKGGATAEDRSKGLGDGEGLPPRTRAGAGADDRSKEFGGSEDHPKA
jgi:hypothetical protein